MKYAEKVGVNFTKGSLFLYGDIAWGTEPWLSTLGKNVHITDGVRFETHDGGSLLYRNQSKRNLGRYLSFFPNVRKFICKDEICDMVPNKK